MALKVRWLDLSWEAPGGFQGLGGWNVSSRMLNITQGAFFFYLFGRLDTGTGHVSWRLAKGHSGSIPPTRRTRCLFVCSHFARLDLFFVGRGRCSTLRLTKICSAWIGGGPASTISRNAATVGHWDIEPRSSVKVLT